MMLDAINDPAAALAALDEDFARLHAKARELHLRQDALREARIAVLEGKAGLPDTPAPALPPPRLPDPRNEGALALLGDLAGIAPAPIGATPMESARTMRLRELAMEEDHVARALDFLREPMRRARRRASIAAWEAMAPEFGKTVTAWCDAAARLEAAATMLIALAHRADAMGAQLPFPVPAHALAMQPDSPTARLLVDAGNAGLFDRRKLPAHLT